MPKIMIVDDEPTTASSLKLLLELDGFEVVVAPTSESAINQAGSQRPDAFLVDYHLADVAGTEFIKKLRTDARFVKTPVIMSSGLNREDEALASGADRFLIKPFDPGELVDLINELLGSK